VWLGCADPVETMAEARAGDPVLSTLCTVLHAWRAVFGDVGQTTQEIASVLTTFDPNARGDDDLIALRTALSPIAGIRGMVDATRLSYWLRKSKGRPVDGLKFTSSTAHGGAQAWQVVSV
jgi:hypothetical protein